MTVCSSCLRTLHFVSSSTFHYLDWIREVSYQLATTVNLGVSCRDVVYLTFLASNFLKLHAGLQLYPGPVDFIPCVHYQNLPFPFPGLGCHRPSIGWCVATSELYRWSACVALEGKTPVLKPDLTVPAHLHDWLFNQQLQLKQHKTPLPTTQINFYRKL